ncbi:hypothetical protein EB796_017956 [Bugula neritina]|uniref:C2H2-type domain-containing protein n=1 Tax=Bugula neritina TaxID=10212 RepID=A0A7J7JDM2_BUGNE|nr:hypothetical protein EB796_017956 [Bugula neritina]
MSKGVLGGCEFEGVEDTAHCGVCDTDVEVSGLEQHLSYHHSSEEIKDGGAEDNYSKREKQCPQLCCTEVFSHWSDLGNHVINTHTPQHMKSLIRHKCTACKEVFLSYYHARSHWEQNAKTCGTGARSIAAESFVAHNLSLDYLTVHHLCSHDFSFTKYKKFTFCSTFKTSHFLLCFVCQRLFSTDAKDLEKASLDEAVESLQQILSDHLRASHQITLTTGYESPPLSYSVSDKEDDGMYDHATDVEEEAAKEIEKPAPEGTSELLVPVKCEQKDPVKPTPQLLLPLLVLLKSHLMSE